MSSSDASEEKLNKIRNNNILKYFYEYYFTGPEYAYEVYLRVKILNERVNERVEYFAE